MKNKLKKVYIWQCQDCGQYIKRTTPNEPRRKCPICRSSGVKTFIKECVYGYYT